MRRHFTAFIALFITFSATAFINIPMSPETPIQGADLICSYPNSTGIIAIDANPNSERVWWGDQGARTGLQMTLVSFERLRCINCYKVVAQLYAGDQMLSFAFQTYHQFVSATEGRVLMHGTLSDSNGNSRTMQLDCGPLPYPTP
ncbi:MAG: hypothetical protein KDD61_00850 [Bdellovibrionales bacterium]|nr:hypothetical protein [Bdellovibrionales bacterium]